MMFSYRSAIDHADVPNVPIEALRGTIIDYCRNGWDLMAFFGIPVDGENGAELIAVLGDPDTHTLEILRSLPVRRYPSVTKECPEAHLFEREIFEQCGVHPQGHPWLKPVRFCRSAGDGQRPGPAQANYFHIEGNEVHEVGVGPIHAGVIEPGHFRFQCYGENVMHLEIQLGFQHRGVEHLISTLPPHAVLPLVENIAGDSAIGHATAYCSIIERLTGTDIPLRAQILRRIALELERLANHTRDLGAIGGDTGFLPTSAWNGRITGDFLNLTSELCGSRFGRNLLCPGGVKWDADPALCQSLIKRLRTAYRDVRGSVNVMLETPSVLARLTGTGCVSHETAVDLGLVGVAARACGIDRDARFDWPLSDLESPLLHVRTEMEGDVRARTLVRSLELDDSAAQTEADLQRLSYMEESKIAADVPNLPAGKIAVALVEGWRGILCHVGVTDDDGGWLAYKIVDPSFHNWMGLAMALRNEQISDFPLCNKSFNLSYCGHDL
ncbi:MAG: NADH-quinone oxidoreductase subunit C [Desulfovibrio sp.]|nr:NADH-quinone oxidoreductase subunit C [Desulfovibrio sp.]